MSGKDGPRGLTKLAQFVCQRLPVDYMVTDTDLKWLDLCDRYLDGPLTNESALHATSAALDEHPGLHIDPFELLIDAGICDSSLNLLP